MNARSDSSADPVRLEDVLITEALARRASRPTDFAAENRALVDLSRELAANPGNLLQKLVEMVLQLCHAESAGISLLEGGDDPVAHAGPAVFRWPAIAGAFANHLDATIPRDRSPCGVVVGRETVELFERPERYFSELAPIDPPVVEALVAPFRVDDAVVGTVWAFSHTSERRFDAEDARMLESLAQFASAGYQAVERTQALSEANDALREREAGLRHMLDALPAAVYTTDAEGRLTHFNAAAAEFSGREPELGTDRWCVTWNLYHPDGTAMPHDQCPMAVAMREGRALRGGGAVAERPDGRRIPFEAYPSPLRDNEGRVVGGINMLVDTTERERMEAELRETREDLTDFVENATVAMHWVGVDGTILWANRAELDLLGYAEDEYVGRHIAEFHADDAAIEDILQRLTRAETLHEYPSRLRCRDGSTRDVLVSSNVRWKDGAFLHTRCFTRDVTEGKRGEETRGRLAAVVESSDDAIVGMDLDGVITDWNGSAERLFGHTAEEAIGQPITLIIPADRAGEEAGILARLRRGERVEHYETVRQHKDGTRLDISLTTSPIVDGQGRVVGASKVARDITERKRTECLVLEQTRLLKRIASGAPLDECLEALCAAVPALGEGVRASVLVADDARAMLARSVAPDLPGSFREGIEGAPIDELGSHGCSRAVFRGEAVTSTDIANDERWSEAWRDLCVAHGVLGCHCEPVVGTSDHAVASFMLCFARPRAPTDWERRLARFGAHVASIALERERSNRALRESEQHLRELSRSLERRVARRTEAFREQTQRLRHLAAELTTAEQRERKRLAAMMHDDLQQLLVAARMQLGRGRERGKGSAEALARAEELLDETVSASRHLTRQLRPPVLYEGGLVSALQWLATEIEERHGLRVVVDADEGEGPSLSDDVKALLFESARELLFNSAKYAGVDEAAVRIDYEQDRLRLVVSDAGRGFDPAEVARSGYSDGFGLFSIRERLGALGGRATIESVAEQGTRVELQMPVALAGPGKRGGSPRGPQISERDPGEGGGTVEHTRVLVVDDHAIVREGIASVLEGDERLVVVGEAGDGVEALELLQQQQPDVVLMDVNMPRMNGIEATREICRRWPRTVTVGLSVQSDAPTAQLMRDAGAAGFVPKTGDSDQMIATILSVMQGGSQANGDPGGESGPAGNGPAH